MPVVPVEWPQAQAVFMLWDMKETVQNVIKTARNVFTKIRPPFQSRTAHGVTQKIIAKRQTGKVKVSFYRITEICRHSVASDLHPRSGFIDSRPVGKKSFSSVVNFFPIKEIFKDNPL
jgi:hypothetical protein